MIPHRGSSNGHMRSASYGGAAQQQASATSSNVDISLSPTAVPPVSIVTGPSANDIGTTFSQFTFRGLNEAFDMLRDLIPSMGAPHQQQHTPQTNSISALPARFTRHLRHSRSASVAGLPLLTAHAGTAPSTLPHSLSTQSHLVPNSTNSNNSSTALHQQQTIDRDRDSATAPPTVHPLLSQRSYSASEAVEPGAFFTTMRDHGSVSSWMMSPDVETIASTDDEPHDHINGDDVERGLIRNGTMDSLNATGTLENSNVHVGNDLFMANVAGPELLEREPPATMRVEFHAFINWVERALPFLILLLLVFVYEHAAGIGISVWLWGVLVYSDFHLKTQVAARENRKFRRIALIVLILGLHIAYIAHLFPELEPVQRMQLLPFERHIDLFQTLFIVFVNDVLIRYYTILAKCIFTLMPARSHRAKAQYFCLMEYASQFYRCMVPIPLWFAFFLDNGSGKVFTSICAGLYLILKIGVLVDNFRQLSACVRSIMHESSYGPRPTPEQVAEAGNTCSICQEQMKAPVLLTCKHMFCEECISEWFLRERTCPLCRANVRPMANGVWRDGSTSLMMQLF